MNILNTYSLWRILRIWHVFCCTNFILYKVTLLIKLFFYYKCVAWKIIKHNKELLIMTFTWFKTSHIQKEKTKKQISKSYCWPKQISSIPENAIYLFAFFSSDNSSHAFLIACIFIQCIFLHVIYFFNRTILLLTLSNNF